nr:MAG TPA: hypothetical protein [Caudoviricetes sp.]
MEVIYSVAANKRNAALNTAVCDSPRSAASRSNSAMVSVSRAKVFWRMPFFSWYLRVRSVCDCAIIKLLDFDGEILYSSRKQGKR